MSPLQYRFWLPATIFPDSKDLFVSANGLLNQSIAAYETKYIAYMDVRLAHVECVPKSLRNWDME